jgi:hypothetical protein
MPAAGTGRTSSSGAGVSITLTTLRDGQQRAGPKFLNRNGIRRFLNEFLTANRFRIAAAAACGPSGQEPIVS